MQKKTDLQSKNMDISQGSSSQTNHHHNNNHQQMALQQQQLQQHIPNQQEDISGRSDDWCSESSSGTFGPLRQLAVKGRSLVPVSKQRKFSLTPSSSNVSIFTSTNTSTSSKTLTETSSTLNFIGVSGELNDASKKPLIAKWKTGVRLQNTSSTSTPDSKGNFFLHYL